MSAAAELSVGAIQAQLGADVLARIAGLEVAREIDSTNSELLRRGAPSAGRGAVLLAERQTAGRGRRGRVWLAAPGEVLCLSIGWTFGPAPDLSALSLAMGVCCANALRRIGVSDVALKWPNDLIAADCKLGGILIETRTEAEDSMYAVIGAGVNLALTTETRAQILASGTEPVDVRSLADPQTGAAQVAAQLIGSMIAGLAEFARSGFRSFAADWNDHDVLRTRPVLVRHASGETRGIARGIDVNGALMVETPRGLERFLSGEVTVRRV